MIMPAIQPKTPPTIRKIRMFTVIPPLRQSDSILIN
jgi:hypothetical protein